MTCFYVCLVVHAKWAIVFAQLLMDGKNEGIHAILVRIRNEDMTPVHGVTIEDMGMKMECNGVDNGKLWFDHVRVPVSHLLNKYSDITDDGQYKSTIQSQRARFLKVADQLLSGRLCIASMCMGGIMAVASVTLRYAMTRKTVGPSGLSDTPIFEYQLFQNTFVPGIARIYVLLFGLQHIQRRWMNCNNDTREDVDEVIRLCCVIKPLITWHFERFSTLCREKCGGQGYLACNRLGSAIGFSHSGLTAEGDNVRQTFYLHVLGLFISMYSMFLCKR
jgi:acyl-CoA oxidase